MKASNTMYHTLYKTTNIVDGKFYIGVHTTINKNDNYLGSGTVFKRQLKKQGEDNFKKTILQTFNTREEALLKEREMVDKVFVKREDTYNTICGGSGNSVFKKRPKEESILLFLELSCSELTYAEIADLLELSPKTIDNYREQLFKKYNVKNRVGLVLYAIRNDIVNVS